MRLSRRNTLRSMGAAGVLGITGCLGSPTASVFQEGFEAGMGEWQTDATIGPEVDLADFAWEVDISDAEAAERDHSLRVWNQGDYDDGVTWASHPVPAEPGQAY